MAINSACFAVKIFGIFFDMKISSILFKKIYQLIFIVIIFNICSISQIKANGFSEIEGKKYFIFDIGELINRIGCKAWQGEIASCDVSSSLAERRIIFSGYTGFWRTQNIATAADFSLAGILRPAYTFEAPRAVIIDISDISDNLMSEVDELNCSPEKHETEGLSARFCSVTWYGKMKKSSTKNYNFLKPDGYHIYKAVSPFTLGASIYFDSPEDFLKTIK